MSPDASYPVMEAFATVQGEGAHTGTPSWFLRLGGCDVGCVWCDVKESWNADAHPRQSVKEIVAAAVDSGRQVVVVTGGEPAMYDLAPLTPHPHRDQRCPSIDGRLGLGNTESEEVQGLPG